MTRKQVKPHGLRVGTWKRSVKDDQGKYQPPIIENELLLPMFDQTGVIRGLQAIFTEKYPVLDRGNILKSDDDPSNYLEPCTDDYNQHFYRDKLGTIFPYQNSPKAKYMHQKLKLGLTRYQVIWLLDKLFDCMRGLQTVVENLPDGSNEELIIKELHFTLTKEFTKYFDYLTK